MLIADSSCIIRANAENRAAIVVYRPAFVIYCLGQNQKLDGASVPWRFLSLAVRRLFEAYFQALVKGMKFFLHTFDSLAIFALIVTIGLGALNAEQTSPGAGPEGSWQGTLDA